MRIIDHINCLVIAVNFDHTSDWRKHFLAVDLPAVLCTSNNRRCHVIAIGMPRDALTGVREAAKARLEEAKRPVAFMPPAPQPGYW